MGGAQRLGAVWAAIHKQPQALNDLPGATRWISLLSQRQVAHSDLLGSAPGRPHRPALLPQGWPMRGGEGGSMPTTAGSSALGE